MTESARTAAPLTRLRTVVDRVARAENDSSLLRQGLTLYDDDRLAVPRWFTVEACTLVVTVAGEARFETGDGSIALTAGMHHVFAPGTHCLPSWGDLDDRDEVVAFSLAFDADEVGRVVGTEGAHADQPPPTGCPLDAELTDATIRLWEAVSTADAPVLGRLYRRELLVRLMTGPYAGYLMPPQHRDDSNLVEQMRMYVRGRLADPISVAELAAVFCLSESAFTRRFRQSSGQSPYQYLTRLRMEHARILLTTQRYSTEQVGRTVGYGSASHFIAEFKRRFGCTPGQYARQWAPRGPVPQAIGL
jgi:AraC-like DNA-binding protein